MNEDYKSALENIKTTLEIRKLQFNLAGRRVVESIILYIEEVLKDEKS